jgi:energy-coupling factor transporter ATP-binding protein EcfA2
LENCYGIQKLKKEFDFSKGKAYAIYAPNGSMKSSLAQTFQDIADGKPSRDRIFPSRDSKRRIVDENTVDLPKENVLVVRPYDEVYSHSEKTSTLLVNAILRREYEQLYVSIDAAKETFLKALKEISGSKKNLEKEISTVFTKNEDQFFRALIRIKDELLTQKDAPFSTVQYDIIFDEKVLGFLGTKDFKTVIEAYVKKYNELLAASLYFKKGTFNYYNAATIAKSLADNGFFEARHTVNLNADSKLEITTEKELATLIAKEKEGTSNDIDLRKKFAEIEKLLTKNVNVRDFEEYLSNHEDLLPKLANIDSFKEEVWKSYFKTNIALYSDLVEKFQAAEQRKGQIEIEAAAERTQWEDVIEIFNSRFFVPFKLAPKNRTSVILGQESMLSLGFIFKDAVGEVPIDRASLMQVLSTGERKALYVLNVIFEIEARKKANQETLLIVDDIADSFDYKNKYAIIQYLKEIAEVPHINQIILTHNFDFFRTINGRFINHPCCYMVTKNNGGLILSDAVGIQNVFINDLKKHFYDQPKKRIACIPFIRNLIEYTKNVTDPDYLKLTSLLHWKQDTLSLKQSDLDLIYKNLFGESINYINPSSSVFDMIQDQASDCLTAADGINFENKIVLSIAIRLVVEKFMANKINDSTFLSSLNTNQTYKLFSKFRVLFNTEVKSIQTIEQVLLMTPENIHLNSFMFEPILDMSDEHLRLLYREALALV